jgi:hypothetical protein
MSVWTGRIASRKLSGQSPLRLGILRKGTATEAQMVYGASDVIAFKDLSTGGNSAGNGGDGYNFGNLTNHQTASFAPINKAYGAEVDAKAGDIVHQIADGSGHKCVPKLETMSLKKGYDKGHDSSDGFLSSESGHNNVKVYADTTAYQTNWAKFDQSANLIAGNGGDGGDGNLAKGGDVSFALVHSTTDYTTTEVKDAFNDAAHFSIDDFLHS